MLKIYNSLEEVPEALREHYKKENGRYVPALSDDHPVLVHNKQLLTDKTTDSARIKELEAEAQASRDKSLPHGHVAIRKAEHEEYGKYKALGAVDEVTVKIAEHGTLKDKDTKRTREDSLKQVASAMGYSNVDAFIRLPGLPEFVSKPSKDGKTVDWFAQLKDDKGVITEKPAKEFIESSPDVQPFMTSLKQSDGMKVPPTGQSNPAPPASSFEWAKNFGQQWNEAAKSGTNVAERFGVAAKSA